MTSSIPPHNVSENGNMFVYIIGAIFMMGLLVVAVRGSTAPGSGIDREALILKASQVQQYGNELERAVRYVMQNGHSESDIRFAHPNASSAYGDITDTPSRQVFDRRGGGAEYRDPPDGIQTTVTPWLFTGRQAVHGVGSGRLGSACITSNNTECTDLIAVLAYVSREFCLFINDKNDITNPSGEPPQDANVMFFAANVFDGNFELQASIADNSGNLYTFGKSEGCLEGDADPAAGTYHYYRVLMPR